MAAETAQFFQQKLTGYSIVHSLCFDARPDFYYDLTLILEKQETGQQIRIVFRDVSNLRIDNFGGGLTQIAPRIDDVSKWQWDRVRFCITDIENERFEFRCFDVDIQD